MTIAEVSKKYGITPDTLRYYERIGLIPGINRSDGGIRNYSETDLKRIEFIKCMRTAGLSIETLSEYISLFRQGDETIERRKQILKEQRGQLAERIAEMQKSLDLLDYKINSYDEVVLKKERELK